MDEQRLPLTEHLTELRDRLLRALIGAVIGFAICYQFIDAIIYLLLEPIRAIDPEKIQLVGSVVTEAFFTKLWVAFIGGIFVGSPIIFYQIWAFVEPGLHASEKSYARPFVLFASFFFISGAAFCYVMVFPTAFQFFIDQYDTIGLVPLLKLSDHISFSARMLLAFGVVFELPVVTFFLAKTGLVTYKSLLAVWRYVVVGVFVVAAILTPPDAVSQVLMAGPLLLLCVLSVGVAYVFGKTPPDDDTKS